MKGSCIINGVDIDDLGIFILKGGDYDFLSFPERETPESNNWYEVDGLDVDLSEVYFKEKSVVVKFYIKAENGDDFLLNLSDFFDLISSGYIELYSREFGKTFRLRYISSPNYLHRGGLYKSGAKRGEITVEFSMDDPLLIFTSNNLVPINGRTNPTYIKVNGYDLAEFGIIVTECYNTLLRLPSVKPPLTRKISTRNGLIAYPSNRPSFEAKQIVINCTMLATDRNEFYHNYEALFNNLTIPEAINFESFAATQQCFYNRMDNFKKLKPFSDGVRVSFSITLTQLASELIDKILDTENNLDITTEIKNAFIGV